MFGIHGIAGIFGAIGLVLFLRPGFVGGQSTSWSGLHQLGVQSIAVIIAFAYAGIVTLVITVILQKTMGFRVQEHEEMAGLDTSQHAEQGYGLIHIN